jgi:hypothetical protein
MDQAHVREALSASEAPFDNLSLVHLKLFPLTSNSDFITHIMGVRTPLPLTATEKSSLRLQTRNARMGMPPVIHSMHQMGSQNHDHGNPQNIGFNQQQPGFDPTNTFYFTNNLPGEPILAFNHLPPNFDGQSRPMDYSMNADVANLRLAQQAQWTSMTRPGSSLQPPGVGLIAPNTNVHNPPSDMWGNMQVMKKK